jgi:hypothetical protein
MSEDTSKVLRIKIKDMPPREEKVTDAQLEEILKRVAGKEGSPCERDCDCGIGLVCRDRVCTSDW